MIKSPSHQTHFKLICNTIKYAKYLHERSAFTYEDEPVSQIDFGKSKYGGPFTTKQVEDVKTFFSILELVLIAGSVFGIKFIKTHLNKATTK